MQMFCFCRLRTVSQDGLCSLVGGARVSEDARCGEYPRTHDAVFLLVRGSCGGDDSADGHTTNWTAQYGW